MSDGHRDERKLQEARRPTDTRRPAALDRDRVLYSSQFARLAEVTQVVSADRGYVVHNRLTHSLKVAQLARRMAERLVLESGERLIQALGGLDPDTAETAALAHDLGHPPFGHVVEDELDELLRKHKLEDGYNGNAQSFRIVSRLAVGDLIPDKPAKRLMPGLNLTRASLNGILKYPWLRSDRQWEKWGGPTTPKR
jgi:dGTPase